MSNAIGPPMIRVGLIDYLRFTRDCLIRAVSILHPDLHMIPFQTVRDCILAGQGRFDVILYYSHADAGSEASALQHVKSLRATFPDVPVVILSDARTAHRPANIRNALNSGARGFIPTKTTEVPAALAAIRFVRDGGTFAPLNLLLGSRTQQTEEESDSSPTARLTERQLVVLSLLREGKSNKVIAAELDITENTVKVHIRNIMRKMGATNRTQAVYMAELLGHPTDDEGSEE
jgi:DNA-binding NarL/FixJ family response regulator